MLAALAHKEKAFEFLVINHDPVYKELLDAIVMVKKFIIDRGLIVYGGSAIDYALRLRGDFIYPDDALAIPDLDFYSANSVEDSYDLADILFEAGFPSTRAIVGMHTDTMRVDFGDNHFIADIHYIPRVIFEKIPTLMYEGMKIVHPSFQRIDLHSALSFPYDNPPLEVIFARWKKDIRRFNKLNAHYPVEIDGDGPQTQKLTVSGIKRFVPTGFLAYAMIYSQFAKTNKPPAGVVPAEFTARRIEEKFEYTFDSLGYVELVHLDPAECAKSLKGQGIKAYEAYSGILPRRLEFTAGAKMIVWSTHNRLVSVNSIVVAGESVRVINVQGLLRHFAAVAILNPGTKLAAACWQRYVSLLQMIHADPTGPLGLSIMTYGATNQNHATEKMLSWVYRELDGTPVMSAPRNYKPGTSQSRGHPFDYESNPVFADCGREISSGRLT